MKSKVVGRDQELKVLKALVGAHRHVLLEGPVGVGKTFLALAVAGGRPTSRVDGDGRYTESKLAGSFDPAMVMQHGYQPQYFTPGPLTQAMQAGGILFINELNRMPEGVQNILIPALDEGLIEVPHLGTIRAKQGFTVIATQNPAEFIGTSFLSEALKDRFELLEISYQCRDEEIAIVQQEVPNLSIEVAGTLVDIVRISRNHSDLKMGASIRAAVGLGTLLVSLADTSDEAILEFAPVALLTRIHFREDLDRAKDSVIKEIVHLALKKKA